MQVLLFWKGSPSGICGYCISISIQPLNPFRSSCYTDGNGPEVFMQCSTKWIRNFDTSKDEYGDSLMIETVINLFFQTSTRILSECMVAKKVWDHRVPRTRFVRSFTRKSGSWERIQIGRNSTRTLWKSFWNENRLSLCSFPQMRSGLAEMLTDLSFKEDHAVGEQQQNLLFLDSKWTIWMVCNLQGRESLQGGSIADSKNIFTCLCVC